MRDLIIFTLGWLTSCACYVLAKAVDSARESQRKSRVELGGIAPRRRARAAMVVPRCHRCGRAFPGRAPHGGEPCDVPPPALRSVK